MKFETVIGRPDDPDMVEGIDVFVMDVQRAFVGLDPRAHAKILDFPVTVEVVQGRVILVTEHPDVEAVDVTNYTPWAIARELNSMIREVCA